MYMHLLSSLTVRNRHSNPHAAEAAVAHMHRTADPAARPAAEADGPGTATAEALADDRHVPHVPREVDTPGTPTAEAARRTRSKVAGSHTLQIMVPAGQVGAVKGMTTLRIVEAVAEVAAAGMPKLTGPEAPRMGLARKGTTIDS